jgi:hypothetical protein
MRMGLNMYRSLKPGLVNPRYDQYTVKAMMPIVAMGKGMLIIAIMTQLDNLAK